MALIDFIIENELPPMQINVFFKGDTNNNRRIIVIDRNSIVTNGMLCTRTLTNINISVPIFNIVGIDFPNHRIYINTPLAEEEGILLYIPDIEPPSGCEGLNAIKEVLEQSIIQSGCGELITKQFQLVEFVPLGLMRARAISIASGMATFEGQQSNNRGTFFSNYSNIVALVSSFINCDMIQ